MQTCEAPDFGGLHKNKNWAFILSCGSNFGRKKKQKNGKKAEKRKTLSTTLEHITQKTFIKCLLT